MGDRIFSVVACLLLLLLDHVSCQADGSNQFIEPAQGIAGTEQQYTNNSVYVVGSEFTIRWQATYSRMSLWLWQDQNAQAMELPNMTNVPTTQEYRWKVDPYDFDIDHGQQAFFFTLHDATTAPGGLHQFNSEYFNTTRAQAATFSMTSSTVPVPSATSSSDLDSSHSPSQSPSPSRDGLTSDGRAGIGAGVAVAAAAVVLICGYIVLNKRRKMLANRGEALEKFGTPIYECPNAPPRGYENNSSHSAQPLAELGASHGYHELSVPCRKSLITTN